MKNVLLLGGRSFLGGHICRALIERGYEVTLHSTSSSGFENLRDFLPHPKVKAVTCSYHDTEALRKLMADSQFLIHAGIPYSIQTLGSSKVILRHLLELESIVQILASSPILKSAFVSVCGTIGPAEKGLADETCELKEPKGWGNLKYKLEFEKVILRHVQKGLQATIVNPTMFIGEFDSKPSTGEFFRFFAKFPFAIFRDKELSIVDVRDVAVGTVLALEKGSPGQRYILSQANTTAGELIKKIKELDGKRMPSVSMSVWMAYFSAYLCEVFNLLLQRPKPLIPLMWLDLIYYGSQHLSHEKAKKELGFAPTDAWAAVERAYRWYKDNGKL